MSSFLFLQLSNSGARLLIYSETRTLAAEGLLVTFLLPQLSPTSTGAGDRRVYHYLDGSWFKMSLVPSTKRYRYSWQLNESRESLALKTPRSWHAYVLRRV